MEPAIVPIAAHSYNGMPKGGTVKIIVRNTVKDRWHFLEFSFNALPRNDIRQLIGRPNTLSLLSDLHLGFHVGQWVDRGEDKTPRYLWWMEVADAFEARDRVQRLITMLGWTHPAFSYLPESFGEQMLMLVHRSIYDRASGKYFDVTYTKGRIGLLERRASLRVPNTFTYREAARRAKAETKPAGTDEAASQLEVMLPTEEVVGYDVEIEEGQIRKVYHGVCHYHLISLAQLQDFRSHHQVVIASLGEGNDLSALALIDWFSTLQRTVSQARDVFWLYHWRLLETHFQIPPDYRFLEADPEQDRILLARRSDRLVVRDEDVWIFLRRNVQAKKEFLYLPTNGQPPFSLVYQPR